jgi:hypothetical protein
MSRLSRLLLCLLLPVVFLACKAKDSKPLESTNVLLKPGTGALLVIFPRDVMIDRSQWRAQVTLEGPGEPHNLPRVPMADSQSLVVLHVVPGTYKVTASAWRHGTDPVSGGTLSSVEVKAGQMTVVRARVLNNDPYPHVKTPLDFIGMDVWLLDHPEKLREYVTRIVDQTARG